MNDSTFLFITKNHCLYDEVKKKLLPHQYLVVSSYEEIEFKKNYNTLIDLTIFPTGNEKKDFLKKLGVSCIFGPGTPIPDAAREVLSSLKTTH